MVVLQQGLGFFIRNKTPVAIEGVSYQMPKLYTHSLQRRKTEHNSERATSECLGSECITPDYAA